MAKKINDTKHTRHITKIMHFVRNGDECNLNKKVWCERCLQLEHFLTNNDREYELDPRLGYAMLIIDN